MHTNGRIYKFTIFRRLADFTRSIYFDYISLKQAINKQDKMEHFVRNLAGYKPRNSDKVKSRAEVLKNAKIFFDGRNLIIYTFEENIFPLPKEGMHRHEEWTEEDKEEENEEEEEEK